MEGYGILEGTLEGKRYGGRPDLHYVQEIMEVAGCGSYAGRGERGETEKGERGRQTEIGLFCQEHCNLCRYVPGTQ